MTHLKNDETKEACRSLLLFELYFLSKGLLIFILFIYSSLLLSSGTAST